MFYIQPCWLLKLRRTKYPKVRLKGNKDILFELAYNALTQWISENGYTPTRLAYEFYLNSPCDTPESELLTRITFPVK
nr:GyrI-like domain-containing protein [Desulfallas thermosapovorans]